jgi:hypothetical protein
VSVWATPGADLREAYTTRVDALVWAAERRSTVADAITHRMRTGDVPAADDPAWSDLEAALAAEDAARAALSEFLDGRRA